MCCEHVVMRAGRFRHQHMPKALTERYDMVAKPESLFPCCNDGWFILGALPLTGLPTLMGTRNCSILSCFVYSVMNCCHIFVAHSLIHHELSCSLCTKCNDNFNTKQIFVACPQTKPTMSIFFIRPYVCTRSPKFRKSTLWITAIFYFPTDFLI
jgi:hypothetical protein